MLLLIGLELEPQALCRCASALLGPARMQILGTAALWSVSPMIPASRPSLPGRMNCLSMGWLVPSNADRDPRAAIRDPCEPRAKRLEGGAALPREMPCSTI